MAIELIKLASPNDGLGNPLRDGGVKINNNFTFLDTTKQNADADLTAIAGLAGTSGLLRKTAANTWTLDTASYLTTSGTAANSQLLDGLDSSQFLRSDVNTTKTAGHLRLNDGLPIQFGNDVDFDLRFDVGTNSARLDLFNANSLLIRDNSTTRFTFERTTGLFTCSQINTGQGATEVHLMNQNVRTTDNVSFNRATLTATGDGIHCLELATERPWRFEQSGTGASTNLALRDTTGSKSFQIKEVGGAVRHEFFTDGNYIATGVVTCSQINTGQGATEVYLMNQNVRTTDNVTFGTVDTGQGANELYAMNQNVRNTDSPIFSGLTITNAITVGSIITSNWTIDQVGNDLVFSYNGAEKLRILSTGGATETV